MPNCGCSGQSCSCLVMSGDGIEVAGTGTQANPYVVSAIGGDISTLLSVNDTTTLDLSLTGGGSDVDPFVLSGTARQALVELRDVGGSAPAVGQVPVWTAAAGGNPARFEFRAPPTTPPGAVTVGAGLTGDGSGGAPLAAATSGVWGTAPLSGLGSDSTIGAPIYVDSAGKLRSMPRGVDLVTDGSATLPAQYPGRVYVRRDTGAAFWSDGTTWRPLNTPTTVGAVIHNEYAQINTGPAGTVTWEVSRITLTEGTWQVFGGATLTMVTGPGYAIDGAASFLQQGDVGAWTEIPFSKGGASTVTSAAPNTAESSETRPVVVTVAAAATVTVSVASRPNNQLTVLGAIPLAGAPTHWVTAIRLR